MSRRTHRIKIEGVRFELFFRVNSIIFYSGLYAGIIAELTMRTNQSRSTLHISSLNCAYMDGEKWTLILFSRFIFVKINWPSFVLRFLFFSDCLLNVFKRLYNYQQRYVNNVESQYMYNNVCNSFIIIC